MPSPVHVLANNNVLLYHTLYVCVYVRTYGYGYVCACAGELSDICLSNYNGTDCMHGHSGYRSRDILQGRQGSYLCHILIDVNKIDLYQNM